MVSKSLTLLTPLMRSSVVPIDVEMATFLPASIFCRSELLYLPRPLISTTSPATNDEGRSSMLTSERPPLLYIIRRISSFLKSVGFT